MILSKPDLKKAVEAGEIVFDPPLEDSQWGPASIDLRLGFQFTRLKEIPGLKISVAEGVGALTGFWETMELPKENDFGKSVPFCLEPGEFVLGMTYEKITVPNNLIAMIEGRSTYARVGLSMHQTAPWIHPGWTNSPIALEIMNNGPLNIELTPIKDRPCQLTFLKLTTPLTNETAYGSGSSDGYQGQEHPFKAKK